MKANRVNTSNVLRCHLKAEVSHTVGLTGVLRQPSFAVADVMRLKCLFIGQRSVSFPHADTGCFVLHNKTQREDGTNCEENGNDDLQARKYSVPSHRTLLCFNWINPTLQLYDVFIPFVTEVVVGVFEFFLISAQNLRSSVRVQLWEESWCFQTYCGSWFYSLALSCASPRSTAARTLCLRPQVESNWMNPITAGSVWTPLSMRFRFLS